MPLMTMTGIGFMIQLEEFEEELREARENQENFTFSFWRWILKPVLPL